MEISKSCGSQTWKASRLSTITCTPMWSTVEKRTQKRLEQCQRPCLTLSSFFWWQWRTRPVLSLHRFLNLSDRLQLMDRNSMKYWVDPWSRAQNMWSVWKATYTGVAASATVVTSGNSQVSACPFSCSGLYTVCLKQNIAALHHIMSDHIKPQIDIHSTWSKSCTVCSWILMKCKLSVHKETSCIILLVYHTCWHCLSWIWPKISPQRNFVLLTLVLHDVTDECANKGIYDPK